MPDRHELDRRHFLKSSVAAATAASIGLPALAQAARGDDDGDGATEAGAPLIRWGRGVCGLCPVGCGVFLGSKDGRLVALKGDPEHPVNRGMLCAKGYALAQLPYGKDRLTSPLLRVKDGAYHKQGKFVPISWQQAFAEMATQFRATHNTKGPTAVGMLISGQQTIEEGYAAQKLVKAGWRSDNLDSSARHGIGALVAAHKRVFGASGHSGSYDDIEATDTAVLWGPNIAETAPILWGRVLHARQKRDGYRIVSLTTHANRCSSLSDLEIIFRPQTESAIFNYIARELIERRAIDRNFVGEYCGFAAGHRHIGVGLPLPENPPLDPLREREMRHKLNDDEARAWGIGQDESRDFEQTDRDHVQRHWATTFKDFKKGVAPYTLGFVAALTKGDPEEALSTHSNKLRRLAGYFANRKRQVLSIWGAGLNQQTRGTWVNEQAHMLHLLTGRVSEPGNGTLCVAGQASAAGTAAEVGTFAGCLPSDMEIGNPSHHAKVEQHWGVPRKTLNPMPGRDCVGMMRGLHSGDLTWLWLMGTNAFHSAPNAEQAMRAARRDGSFIVVSDAYPTSSCKMADLILPSALSAEKWGTFGNLERRTQGWQQQVQAPGEARTDLWQLLTFAKSITIGDVWKARPVPGLEHEGYDDNMLPDVSKAGGRRGLTEETSLFETLFETPKNLGFSWPDSAYPGVANATADATPEHDGFAWFPEKALFEEYAEITREEMSDLASFDHYAHAGSRGLQWPVVENKETKWRFNALYDPHAGGHNRFWFYGPRHKYLRKGGLVGISDANREDLEGRAKIFIHPYVASAEPTDGTFDLTLCMGRVLEHTGSGTRTRRAPQLHKALPTAEVSMHRRDAYVRDISPGQLVWIESRRSKIKARISIDARNQTPRGQLFLPHFDEQVAVNRLTADARCPISLQADVKTCPVKVYPV